MVLESLCNFFRLVISFTLSASLVILSSVPWILLSQSFVLSILIIVFLVLKFLYSSSYSFFLFVKFIYLLKLFFSFVSSIFTFLQSRIFTITVFVREFKSLSSWCWHQSSVLFHSFWGLFFNSWYDAWLFFNCNLDIWGILLWGSKSYVKFLF